MALLKDKGQKFDCRRTAVANPTIYPLTFYLAND